ncbi:hypothetical protein ACHMW7_18495 [Aminobacter sp. UC22_36]|uniref:hypothetical protein n=1 Tax=Aminobacter sp. UC22_36 TaxID=3374549 RepID=UPI003756B0B9
MSPPLSVSCAVSVISPSVPVARDSSPRGEAKLDMPGRLNPSIADAPSCAKAAQGSTVDSAAPENRYEKSEVSPRHALFEAQGGGNFKAIRRDGFSIAMRRCQSSRRFGQALQPNT